MLSVSEVFEKKTNSVKNYGIVLRYRCRTGYINMYREFRDVSLNGAVSQLHMEMSGKHEAPLESIQIIKTSVVEDSDSKKLYTQQYLARNLRFPRVKPLKRSTSNSFRSTFKATRAKLI